MDWDYYGGLIPEVLIERSERPQEVVVAAFVIGYPVPYGYWSGIAVGGYRLGKGHMVINTLRVLENLGRHPVAGRLLLNVIEHERHRIDSAHGPT